LAYLVYSNMLQSFLYPGIFGGRCLLLTGGVFASNLLVAITGVSVLRFIDRVDRASERIRVIFPNFRQLQIYRPKTPAPTLAPFLARDARRRH